MHEQININSLSNDGEAALHTAAGAAHLRWVSSHSQTVLIIEKIRGNHAAPDLDREHMCQGMAQLLEESAY